MDAERLVYVDNAATTKVSKSVIDAMMPYFHTHYGNPSSELYGMGREARVALEKARLGISEMLGCEPGEVFFTSGGTEADNWAIKGIAESAKKAGKGNHIITSKIEHHAVLHTLERLEKQGFEISYLDVYDNGIVRAEDLEKAIKPETILVTVMFANNEIGTIQPIKELAEISHKHKIPFFTDAVQAVGKLDINIKELGIDALALSGHKLHTPKGIGALYVRKGLKFPNLIEGGGQEKGRRSGTENVAGAVALEVALRESLGDKEGREKVRAMRDYLAENLSKIPYSRINGDMKNRLVENLNVAFEFIEGEGLIMLLDMVGICASTGSACSTSSLEPSHVLRALGLPHEICHGSLRISLSSENTMEEMDYIIEKVTWAVGRLRSMSPLYEKLLESQKTEQ
ncbi:MAG: aminotransferase class V-fold PLP-dependent enzyme [Eubacteriales bacterium]|nr:aminotransferase class V-fold PLP-dependent enzyme [Eubacteriales bacterium]MDD4474507.1 aminotransferase class V-fold PLP-dependent enzyme [Eubacteriales bacterium]